MPEDATLFARNINRTYPKWYINVLIDEDEISIPVDERCQIVGSVGGANKQSSLEERSGYGRSSLY